MCQGRVEFESIELSHLVSVPKYFAAELEDLQPFRRRGSGDLDDGDPGHRAGLVLRARGGGHGVRPHLVRQDPGALLAHHLRMDLALVLSAVMLGLAGMPHCVAMCAAPCGAHRPGRAGRRSSCRRLWAFHAARILSLRGWPARSWRPASVHWRRLGQWSPALQAAVDAAACRGVRARPVAAVAAAVSRPGWRTWAGRAARCRAAPGAGTGSRARRGRALPALAWAAWPCGLLQSALLMAALANGAAGGAAVMAGVCARSRRSG